MYLWENFEIIKILMISISCLTFNSLKITYNGVKNTKLEDNPALDEEGGVV
jgi:hypothetical protein